MSAEERCLLSQWFLVLTLVVGIGVPMALEGHNSKALECRGIGVPMYSSRQAFRMIGHLLLTCSSTLTDAVSPQSAQDFKSRYCISLPGAVA